MEHCTEAIGSRPDGTDAESLLVALLIADLRSAAVKQEGR